MPANRVSGTLYVKIGGVQRNAIGNWTYNLAPPKREAQVGPDRVHGYKEMPQAPFFEGEIRDDSDLSLAELQAIDDETATLELANGKTIVLRNCWYAADGDVGTEEANVQVRLVGREAVEA